jgi:hypothetical protein
MVKMNEELDDYFVISADDNQPNATHGDMSNPQE